MMGVMATQQDVPHQPLAYTVSEAADQLRISRSSIYRLIDRNELATAKIGKRRLILHDDVVALLERSRVA